MPTEAGTIAAILGLTTAMLGAMVAACKQLSDFYKTALTTCQTEKTTCYAENKVTVERAYNLVDAFKDLKGVTADSVQRISVSADRLVKIEKAIDDLQRDLARLVGS